MDVSGVKPEDIVLCDIRGDRFLAFVREPVHLNKAMRQRVLRVDGVTGRPIPTHFIKPRQVISHWRKSRRSRI